MKQSILLGFLIMLSLNLLAQTNEKSEAGELTIDSVNVENVARFPGGRDSLDIYLEKNNRWTVGRKTISGRVYIQFYVHEDGAISGIQIVKGLPVCEECEKEAVRLVKNMPNWIPAELNGRPIKSKVIVPIAFDGMK